MNLLAITQGRSAAAKIFDTIDRVPHIDSANPTGKLEDIHGELTLEGVILLGLPSKLSRVWTLPSARERQLHW